MTLNREVSSCTKQEITRCWAAELFLQCQRNFTILLRYYFSSTCPYHRASKIYIWKVGRKIHTDSEVVDEPTLTMIPSLNTTIKHKNSKSVVADTRSAPDQNVAIPMLDLSGKTKKTLSPTVCQILMTEMSQTSHLKTEAIAGGAGSYVWHMR